MGAGRTHQSRPAVLAEWHIPGSCTIRISATNRQGRWRATRRWYGVKTVLVVDDDAGILSLCKDVLETEGYLVRTAATAQEGRELMKALRPDAALVDLRLPDGSGADLARAAQEVADDPAVIVITAFGSKEAVVESLRAGVRDFVEKPFRREQLLHAVERALVIKAGQEDSRRLQALMPLFEMCERIGSTVDLDLALDIALSAAMQHTRALGGFAVTRGTLASWRPRWIRGLPLSAGPVLEKDLAALLADAIDRSTQSVVLLNVRENPWLGTMFEKGEPANRHPEDYWLLCGCIGRPGDVLGLLGLYAGPDTDRLRRWGPEVLGIICRQLAAAAASAERYEALGAMQDEAMAALGGAVDRRDPYMMGHSRLVAQVADQIASARAIAPDERQILQRAARLHDIGMIAVPDSILAKQSALEPDEIEVIRQHPAIGAEIVGEARSLRPLVPAVRGHHERFDGSGYPDGLSEEQIPLAARILAVAEAYSAMISDRPYRPAMSLAGAIAELSAGAGQQFDPDVVAAFSPGGREGR